MLLNVGSSVKDADGREYVLDEIIGQGGFGYVFKSHRKNDNAVYAVKAMLPSFGDSSSLFAFNNEIQSSLKVMGDNIIKYEFAHNGELYSSLPPYIIMEYANGGTLRNYISQRKSAGQMISTSDLLKIYIQLATGMKTINDSLVHRDIKPENILINNNVIKITDFGLSKIASENTRTETFKGSGTARYMAPEAWDFSKNTIQMDIYSMGIIFYELATLCYPYEPEPKTRDECKNVHYYSPICRIETKNSTLPPSIVSIIYRMLEKSTKKRFNNWNEILTLLQSQNDSPKNNIEKIASIAVASLNMQDSKRQQQETERIKAQKEKMDFCKLIYSQFQNTIISPLETLFDTINSNYAGKGKIKYSANTHIDYNKNLFYWKADLPSGKSLNINLEIIFEENHQRRITVANYFGDNTARIINYIPQYNGKNILLWCEITNNNGYGFNLLLVDADEIYGEWLIMDNKNNLSHLTNSQRAEPFAFSIKELPEEIEKVQHTHLYSSEFKEFDQTVFLQKIQNLTFNL